MTTTPDRRVFLAQSTLAAAAALGGVHAMGAEQPARVTLGVIGCGGIMGLHLRGLVGRQEAVSLAWLCDVDPAQIEKAANLVAGYQGAPPKPTSRYEDVLDDTSVDAVIIATPHHWHAPIALRAILAGKDVYVEKPLSHVYAEGPLMIEAARRHKRVVQQGSQMRSSPVTAEAAKVLASGVLGEIRVARAWTAEPRSTVRPVPDGQPPAGVDYDRWLGPAPSRPFNQHRFHGTWRMYRDYANGEIGDDGIHDIDMACWGLGVVGLPSQVTARGGRMKLEGHAGDYPDNMHAVFEFPDGRLIVYENLPFTPYGMHGFDNGNVFYGDDGYMIFSRRGAFSTFLGPKQEKGPTESRGIRGERGYAEHMHDFLDAVRHRRLETHAPPETAHISCALVHFGDIAYRTEGRLEFDPLSEAFTDSDAANALLFKEYRKPYGLPEIG